MWVVVALSALLPFAIAASLYFLARIALGLTGALH